MPPTGASKTQTSWQSTIKDTLKMSLKLTVLYLVNSRHTPVHIPQIEHILQYAIGGQDNPTIIASGPPAFPLRGFQISVILLTCFVGRSICFYWLCVHIMLLVCKTLFQRHTNFKLSCVIMRNHLHCTWHYN